MKDCTTCKYGFEDERLGIPMCHHPLRFSEDCVDFNMHEKKKEPKKATGIVEKKLSDELEEAADAHIRRVADAAGHPGWDWETQDIAEAFKAGAEWMAGQGWHDVTETPSIFGFYLVIHEKGWCVANYMGKGTVCESGWVEAIHHIEIEHPQKWLDLRDLIPKKQ